MCWFSLLPSKGYLFVLPYIARYLCSVLKLNIFLTFLKVENSPFPTEFLRFPPCRAVGSNLKDSAEFFQVLSYNPSKRNSWDCPFKINKFPLIFRGQVVIKLVPSASVRFFSSGPHGLGGLRTSAIILLSKCSCPATFSLLSLSKILKSWLLVTWCQHRLLWRGRAKYVTASSYLGKPGFTCCVS